MKFVQLSTIASLAIFSAAPGVSAAGLRARHNHEVEGKVEVDNSDRRKLQYEYAYGYGRPNAGNMGIPDGMFPQGVFPGNEGEPNGLPIGQNYGIPAQMGMHNTFPGGSQYRPSAENYGIPPAFEHHRHLAVVTKDEYEAFQKYQQQQADSRCCKNEYGAVLCNYNDDLSGYNQIGGDNTLSGYTQIGSGGNYPACA